MSSLKASIVGFDITPRIHPKCGAWGTTASMAEIDMPLMARCLALEQDGRRLIWFGSDLVGENLLGTDVLRDEIANALGLIRDQVVWSTSQTHSSGALPGSISTGSSICDLSLQAPEFAQAERKRFIKAYIEAAREAIARLQPVNVWAGRGYCDSMSYNTRFPMPTGGVKFSRNYTEGLQSGKFFDPTIGLVRFEDKKGNPLGAIFNFCAHPATMVSNKMVSPDYVGTARQYIEESISMAPAMFVQGFCGDVNCYHIFGTPAQARRNGERLGNAAVEAMQTLVPVRGEPFHFLYRTFPLPRRPMYTREEIKQALEARYAFIDELKEDPLASWVCGINLPEQFSVSDKIAAIQLQINYLKEGLHMIEAGELPPSQLPFTLGAIRIGDVAAVLSHGENFTATGMKIRMQSPFVHTLICGDTNGLFGYIGDDAEIIRGGYETDTYWKMLCINGFCLALAKGSVDLIINTAVEMLKILHRKEKNP